jgi:tRNA-dihydrouridine synthase A
MIAQKEVSVAPMMDWTDRHCRYFHRLISPHARLYTEMVTTGAIIHGDRERFLRFSPAEHPIALQLGGSEPDDLATCAAIGEEFGYDEININCGCPSDRVQKGAFGACLMERPETVAASVAAMVKATALPVTVKCRIGIDNSDDLPFLDAFIGQVADAGCGMFIIHARKAWLQGLSPKENREVPPLRYDIAAAIKFKYPHLRIVVNGGIRTIEDVKAHLEVFDGVMIGREAYQNPWFLADIEREIFGNANTLPADTVVRAMIPYIRSQQKQFGTPVKSIVRHMTGMFPGERGARKYRQILSSAHEEGTQAEILEKALEAVQNPAFVIPAAAQNA